MPATSPRLSFSSLPDDRVLEAFEMLRQVGRWIEGQGRRQRISKTTLESYQQWQSENANYVVLSDDMIVGLVTLRRETLNDWANYDDLGPVWMIRGLATHPDFRHHGIGTLAVNEAIRLVPEQDIYLDCVSEFLPGYYSQFGFVAIDQQLRTFVDDHPLDITLMVLRQKSR